MNKSQLEGKIDSAINMLIENDSHLLAIDINERSISHRLALYLQQQFIGWDVDCEYNRNGDDTKRLFLSAHIHMPDDKVQTNNTKGEIVIPDIIIHHRGTNDNLLVIEMKKTSSNVSNEFDLFKLKEYGNQLGYKYRIFLHFNTDGENLKEVKRIWV